MINFGKNIKMLRTNKKMSIQALSSQSGVSASMLSNLERGKKVPTLRTALQITNALQVALSEVIDKPDPGVLLLRKQNQQRAFDPISEAQGNLLTPLFAPDGVEFLSVSFPSGKGSIKMPPRQINSKEYLVVHQGQLQIVIGNEKYDLEEGDSISYHANVERQFINTGKAECRYYRFLVN